MLSHCTGHSLLQIERIVTCKKGTSKCKGSEQPVQLHELVFKHILNSEAQIRRGIEDKSKIIFLISQ